MTHEGRTLNSPEELLQVYQLTETVLSFFSILEYCQIILNNHHMFPHLLQLRRLIKVTPKLSYVHSAPCVA